MELAGRYFKEGADEVSLTSKFCDLHSTFHISTEVYAGFFKVTSEFCDNFLSTA